MHNTTTLDRNISNASIVIGGGSSAKIPMKARPKTGINRLSSRARRGMLKQSAKLSKNLGSSINVIDSPKQPRMSSSPHLKLSIRQSSNKRGGLNSSAIALSSNQRGLLSVADNEMLTNLDLRHDQTGMSP